LGHSWARTFPNHYDRYKTTTTTTATTTTTTTTTTTATTTTTTTNILCLAYYRGAHGVLVIFDVTDRSTFLNIRKWVRAMDQHADENVEKILIGNKSDMLDSKVDMSVLKIIIKTKNQKD